MASRNIGKCIFLILIVINGDIFLLMFLLAGVEITRPFNRSNSGDTSIPLYNGQFKSLLGSENRCSKEEKGIAFIICKM